MERRLNGFYETRQTTNDTFRIEIEEREEGRWLGYDSLSFQSRGNHVDTPQGYENTVAGAYQYASKIFGVTDRN